MECIRGQKFKLTDLTPSHRLRVEVDLEWTQQDDLDIACFGLDASGKIKDDNYFIFYNQPKSPEGALSCSFVGKGKALFDVELDRLPAQVQRLTFTAAVDGASSVSQMGSGMVRLLDGSTELMRFAFSGKDFASEKAVMLFDIYYKDQWRGAAVGQGFNAGLAALLEHFGGEVQAPPPPPPPPPAPPAPTVSLSKITLEKRGDSRKVDLRKKDGSSQKIHINLNWNQVAKKAGFFSRTPKAADLDLGCMYELRNGDKGVIQALGGNFGNQNAAPWIFLDKDDRSGAVSDGENLFVYKPEEIRKVLVFAFVYGGTGNFVDVDGRVMLSDGMGNETTVRLDSPESGKTFCAICLLQPSEDTLTITKEERYFRDHSEADAAYGFGFRWRSGQK